MSITEQEAPPPKALRPKHAAPYCGLSLSTLNRLAGTGDGPVITDLSPGCRAYLVADLDAWLASRPKYRSTAERTVAGRAA